LNSQKILVSYLINIGVLQSKLLIKAFESVDRKDFVLPSFKEEAYENYPLSIGNSQTISQPYTVAFMLELLDLNKNDTVLDIGVGSGWTSAIMGSIVKKVTGVERIVELLDFAKHNLQKYNFNNVSFKEAGSELGRPKEKFNKILVSAAAKSLPETLLNQLKPKGNLVIPINNDILLIHKKDENIYEKRVFSGFVFVPLL